MVPKGFVPPILLSTYMAAINAARSFINELWDASIVPTLAKYIAIPNLSPHYDPEWATNGHQERAMALLVDWVSQHKPAAATYELFSENGRTPFLAIDVPPTTAGKGGHVLMYGHMDKQPPMLPWAEGLGPCIPVIRDGKLYGRGGADDGYAVFAAIASVLALQRQNVAHGHITIVIEACEESGSTDLPYWIEKTKDRYGPVDLVVCLDSGAAAYDRMWLTDSLRGVCSVKLTVQTTKESIHSGLGGGVVPDPLRIVRILLNRIEDTDTGDIKLPSLNVRIPETVAANLVPFRAVPHGEFMKQFPFLDGVRAPSNDHVDLMLRTSWKPSMTVIGYDGAPETAKGGNVIRTDTSVKISIRLPPTAVADDVRREVQEVLERDPPCNARVAVEVSPVMAGWCAPPLEKWLHDAATEASKEEFNGNTFGAYGIGGSIPFMAMLGRMFPQAQFVVTGVLGPESNAHGPNEFLHIDFGKGITRCVSTIVRRHCEARSK